MPQPGTSEANVADLTTGLHALELNNNGSGIAPDALAEVEEAQHLPESHSQPWALLDLLARSRIEAYLDQGDVKFLDDAIENYRMALVLQSSDPSRLSNIANCFIFRFRDRGDETDLEDAVKHHREAVCAVPSSHSARASIFTNAAAAFSISFDRFHREEDLDSTILCLREVIRFQPHGADPNLCKLGDYLLRRFHLLHRTKDLDEAIYYYRQALQTLSSDDSLRITCLNNLGRSLLHSFEISEDASDIDDAVNFSMQAIASQLPSHPDRASSLDDLATALRIRFQISSNVADVDQCLGYQKEALALTPPDDPDRAARLSNFALCLLRKFQQSGTIMELEESISSYREVLRLQPVGDPHRPISLNDFATALSSRFEVLEFFPDLDESVVLCREAVLLCPKTHSNYRLYLGNLVKILRARFSLLKNEEDLNDTIRQQRNLLCLHPPGDIDRPSCLIQLGDDLSSRFAISDELKDLDNAIENYTDAASFPGHDCTDKLVRALRLRFGKSGEAQDLDQVIERCKNKLAGLPTTPKDRAHFLVTLSDTLVRRFQLLADLEDLEEAIRCNEEALLLVPRSETIAHATYLTFLSHALCNRFQSLDQIDDIDRAIQLQSEALQLYHSGIPNRAASLQSLSTMLQFQFQRLCRREDIDEAIALCREGFGLCLPPELTTFVDLLVSETFASRFQLSGDMAYLEKALMHAHRALDHEDSALALGNLADCLLMRFIHLGRLSDLESAIKLYRQIHTLGSEPSQGTLMNMAYSLVTSFRISNKVDDLEEGLVLYRNVLELCEVGDEARPVCLNNLANALRVRFYESKQISDVNEAIGYYREALDLSTPEHPSRNMYLLNLGTTFLSRFEIVRDNIALDEALQCLEDAENNFPVNDPLHALSQFNLGTALWQKYQVAPDSEQPRYTRALSLLENATRLPYSSVKARFEAAIQWTAASHSHHDPSTRRAYSCSLDLLEKWMIVNPEVEAQHRFLATEQARSLACDGAAVAIDSGDLNGAVELLEHGRTVLWSRLQGYRQPLDLLRLKDEGLAERFESLSRELEDLSLRSETNDTNPVLGSAPGSKDVMKTQRILSEQWDEVVSQIRQIDGFAHFLQPKPYSILQHACSDGPVILINISRFRSDAIILLMDRPPTLVPLPNVSPLSLLDLYSKLLVGLKSRTDAAGATKQLVPILRLLWAEVVQPVVHQLLAFGVKRHSRIWWCPTSYLCCLPLHAAGRYSKDDPQPSLPDLFVSSYTPTLSALIRARNTTQNVTVPKILVVGQAQRGLPAVEQEIQELESLGPFVRTLVGQDTTRENVTSGLEQHTWVHFACHAKQDPLPFHSSFELYDGQITLLELIRSRRPNAQFAFLSACNTATGDLETPDETLHLAAALQFSGFQSVVGTLWPMADPDGPHIAREFYRHLFELGQGLDRADARDSAVALSVATKYLRKKGVPLDRWINFVHIGA